MIDKNVFFGIPYGLYVLATREGYKDNGSVINTVMQITDSPKRICVGVNKSSYNCDLISRTGVFNVCALSEDVPFSLIQKFGFQSGRDTDKTDGEVLTRSDNGVMYLTEHSNFFISAKVAETVDCGTHKLFVADVTEAVILSDAKTVTYDYYQKNIKPAPEKKKKGYVCKICGYVYEGEPLPEDYVCPICGHGADDFEPLA